MAGLDEALEQAQKRYHTPAAGPAAAESGPRISAPPSGFFPAVSRWASDAANDVIYGGNTTVLGRGLNAIHARPLIEGVSPGAAEFMGSPVLGPLRAVKGLGEVGQPGQRWKGAGDITGGALEAAQIPLGMMGGPTATEVLSVPGALARRILPNAEHAGRVFQEVSQAAGQVEPSIAKAGDVALKLKEYADAGGSLPKVARDFLRRATGPNEPAILFPESRLFQSNASRLSANEANRLTPVAKRYVGQFAHSLGEANQAAAEQVGKGEQFRGAMNEYRRAKQLEDVQDRIKALATSTAGKIAAGAALGAGGYPVYRGARRLFGSE